MLKQHLMWTIGLAGSICWATALSAGDEAMSDVKLEARWRAAAIQVRNCFAEWNGVIYCCAAYDAKYANSNHMDPRQWAKDNTATLEFDRNRQSWIKPETLVPPAAEIDAYCKMLPSFAVGHYGTITSATIEAVKPGVGFVLRDVKLVDEQATQAAFEKDQAAYDQWLKTLQAQLRQENHNRRKSKEQRVKGPGWEGYVAKRKEAMTNRYSERSRLVQLQEKVAGRRILVRGPVNSSLVPGREWNGQRTPIAITGYTDDPLEEGQTILSAVVVEQFRKGITADQLAAVVENLKVSREQFVTMLDAANAEDKSTANMKVLAKVGFKVPQIRKPKVQAEPEPEPEPRKRRFDEFVK
jgi:hypothetical protein